jgi:hypothetical protein
MDNEIIQAYLWREVIRLGFSPSGKGDMKNWLVQYGRSLKDFWEIDEYPELPAKIDSTIKGKLLTNLKNDLFIEYGIKRDFNYSLTFLFPNTEPKIMWSHDVDTNNFFLFPEHSLLNKYGKLQTARRNVSSGHIKKVLDGLIFHPAVHQHIESPIDRHEIRIGGGIYNPFVFLFHLRYQFCPDNDKREAEKERLVTLFERAIRDNNFVTTNELFNI